MREVRRLAKMRLFLGLLLGALSTGSSCEENGRGSDGEASMASTRVPQLASISPSQGPSLGGVTLSLLGADFAYGATVTIDGKPATDVMVWSGSLITAKLPASPGMLGKVQVVVQNSAGQRVSRDDLFAYHVGQLPFGTIALGRDSTTSTAVGDFNSDGQLDLIATTGQGVLPYLSNGLGGYLRTAALLTGSNPTAVIAGDWNGDERLDLAVANGDSRSVSVLLGDGEGGFTQSRLTVGASPRALAAADWNGDQKLDLAVANAEADDVYVFLGSGSGRFNTPLHVATGTRPIALACADWNADGNLDLVTANQGSNDISVLLGDGHGGLASAARYVVGTTPAGLATGDVNGDGIPDLAISNQGSDDVSVLLGDGRGGVASTSSFAVGTQPRAIALSDFDGDRKLDLAVATSGTNGSIYSGDGAGHFSWTQELRGSFAAGLSVGDFNGDSKVDLATGLFLLLNDGRGKVGSTRMPIAGITTLGPWIAVGDWNGDQNPDLAVPSPGALLTLLFGDGHGGFVQTSLPVGNGGPIATGDWNGDQKQDIAIAGPSKVTVLLGDDTGNFSAPIDSVLSNSSVYAMAVGDFNGDQRSDLAVSTYDSTAVLLGNGAGNFFQITSMSGGSAIAVADFDGDKKADVIVTNGSGFSPVSLYPGKGDGRFLPGSTLGMFQDTSGLAIGDFNNDKRPDLAISTWASGGFVLTSRMDGGLGAATNLLSNLSLSPAWVVTGDVNGV